MCSKDDIKKIDSGTHVLVKKNDRLMNWVRSWLSPALIIAGLLWVSTFVANYDNRTFKDAHEKDDVIDFVNAGHPITDVEADNLKEHTKDEDLHLDSEEVKDLIIVRQDVKTIKETQVKLGQDLEQIKNLIINQN